MPTSKTPLVATTTFNSDEFWSAFLTDIKYARRRLIIQSPFIASKRLMLLADAIQELLARGVVVCVFIQEPKYWNTDLNKLDNATAFQMRELRANLKTLMFWGVHVNLPKSIHAKFAVVDEELLWEGSLNILSHSNTKEHMRRWINSSEVDKAIEKNALKECWECKANYVMFGFSDAGRLNVQKIGQLLATVRKSQLLSQRAVASDCEISSNRLCQIESGRNIRLDSLLKILDALWLDLLLIPKENMASVTNFLQRVVFPNRLKDVYTRQPELYDPENGPWN